MEQYPYIELILKGSPDDEGKVRVKEFITTLENLRICVQKLDKHLRGKVSTFYRIKELKSSIPRVVIEAVPFERKEPTDVLDRFMESIHSIQEQNSLPEWFKDTELLEAFKGLTSQFRKHVSYIEIRSNGKSLQLSKQLEINIEKILGKIVSISKGTITGHLDTVNVHGVNHFYIYPPIGPAKIRCIFKEELLEKVKQGIKRYVNVVGMLHYKKDEAFPTKIDAEDMEVYPHESELPKLGDLFGMAPQITGELDTIAFIRKLREKDED